MPTNSVKSPNRSAKSPNRSAVNNKVTFYLIGHFGNRTKKTLNRNNVEKATRGYNKLRNFKINGHNVYQVKSHMIGI